ncbi:hypothetical protein FDECE_12600 [Fusarium decemcellulare]|nr:hypothetical protein FDECE_12600 [Fusarium decemcellulare]
MRHSSKHQPAEESSRKQTGKSKSHSQKHAGSSKQLRQLYTLYDEAMDTYNQSALAKTFEDMLRVKNRPRVTRVISLGLGSLLDAKNQQRRIKQLVIFMAIASHLTLPSTDESSLALYAQDPTFTPTDETFLQSLGICVLKTPSLSDLGEAGRMIDEETLIYSPFLTIATYKLLLDSSSHLATLPMLISDDFNALRLRWDKRTSERRDVEGLIRETRSENYQRRAVNGEGFWRESDRPFPMALYWRPPVAGDRRTTNPATVERIFKHQEPQLVRAHA